MDERRWRFFFAWKDTLYDLREGIIVYGEIALLLTIPGVYPRSGGIQCSCFDPRIGSYRKMQKAGFDESTKEGNMARSASVLVYVSTFISWFCVKRDAGMGSDRCGKDGVDDSKHC